MPSQPQFTPPASPATPLGAHCPFVVGRPLSATEPMFGRQALLDTVVAELGRGQSVNLVGERRMGKTSLLNHLEARLGAGGGANRLVVVRVDMQSEIDHASRFYGAVIADLNQGSAAAGADFDSFRSALRASSHAGVPVLIMVDEFERMFEHPTGFPNPDFFNGLRSLQTEQACVLAVATRQPLMDYFRVGRTLTSTFPTYCIPHALTNLPREAADRLLSQPSDRPLTPAELATAWQWTAGHPCRHQAAGLAFYESKATGAGGEPARKRFDELIAQVCMTPDAPLLHRPRRLHALHAQGWLRLPLLLWRSCVAVLRLLLWRLPLAIGGLAKLIGTNLNDGVKVLIGAAIILLAFLMLTGKVKPEIAKDILEKLLQASEKAP